jgi:cytochrome c biogenesis protein CcmG/thiol:disulfide interchange protein DsbE
MDAKPTDAKPADAKPKRGPSLALLIPLGFFIALALIFFTRLTSGVDPEAIPSALVGKPAPVFELPPLDGVSVPGISSGDLDGQVTLVNIFASWCGPCRIEHPVLEELAKDDRIRLVGINYKDQPANARRFLGELGNPYAAIGVDQNGRTAIDWGVYGVPETFVVGPDGIILAKHIGPLTADAVARRITPAVDKALAAGS